MTDQRCGGGGRFGRLAWIAALSMCAGLLDITTALADEPRLPDEPAGLPHPLANDPLSERGLENLVAMTRLLGYVRFFHPADSVVQADWDEIAIAGARTAEPAIDAADLGRRLETWIRPVAPTVRVRAANAEDMTAAIEDPQGDDDLIDESLRRPEGEKPASVVHWRHQGINLTKRPGGPYFSRRETTQLQVGEEPKSDANPGRPMVLELGGGVCAVVPRFLYEEREGDADADGDAFPEAGAASVFDRAVRFADVALVWTVMQHFYPYFDVIEPDWDAALVNALQIAATDSDAHAFWLTLRRLIAELHDGHGQVAFDRNANFFTPPVVVDRVDGQWVITHVEGEIGSTIKPGDVIRGIDGTVITEHAAALEATVSGATPQWIEHRVSRELLTGPNNSMITLEVAHPVDGARSVRVRRTVHAMAVREKRPKAVEEIEPGIWYVNMDQATDIEFSAAVEKMAAAEGVIFDMRGYPSRLSIVVVQHLIDKPVTCAQWHIPIVTKPDREDMTFQFSNWPVPPKKPRIQGNVAFIIDGRAISYAETYMGIIEHYKLGAIVGEATAGTNGNVSAFTVPGGYHVAFTGMKVLKHDGAQHHGVGILPTVPCQRTLQGVLDERDELLERAIKVVKQQD
jgi:C-terminal processing protease CtpA/Prc